MRHPLVAAAASLALAAVSAWAASGSGCGAGTHLGFYPLQCDDSGNIVTPWPSLRTALDAEMKWSVAWPPLTQ